MTPDELSIKTMTHCLQQLYRAGKEERLRELSKILSSKRAESQSKASPKMNGEGWLEWAKQELNKLGVL